MRDTYEHCVCWDYETPDTPCKGCQVPAEPIATASIWYRHCDPERYRRLTVYSKLGHAAWSHGPLSPIELGAQLDLLASAEIRKVLGVARIMIDNERLPRKCREIECDHCHSRGE
jgi:hypothetical protein